MALIRRSYPWLFMTKVAVRYLSTTIVARTLPARPIKKTLLNSCLTRSSCKFSTQSSLWHRLSVWLTRIGRRTTVGGATALFEACQQQATHPQWHTRNSLHFFLYITLRSLVH